MRREITVLSVIVVFTKILCEVVNAQHHAKTTDKSKMAMQRKKMEKNKMMMDKIIAKDLKSWPEA